MRNYLKRIWSKFDNFAIFTFCDMVDAVLKIRSELGIANLIQKC